MDGMEGSRGQRGLQAIAPGWGGSWLGLRAGGQTGVGVGSKQAGSQGLGDAGQDRQKEFVQKNNSCVNVENLTELSSALEAKSGAAPSGLGWALHRVSAAQDDPGLGCVCVSSPPHAPTARGGPPSQPDAPSSRGSFPAAWAPEGRRAGCGPGHAHAPLKRDVPYLRLPAEEPSTVATQPPGCPRPCTRHASHTTSSSCVPLSGSKAPPAGPSHGTQPHVEPSFHIRPPGGPQDPTLTSIYLTLFQVLWTS